MTRKLCIVCALLIWFTARAFSQVTTYGGSVSQPIATPAQPTLTPIVGGAAGSYSYVVVFKGPEGCTTVGSTAGTTAVGPTTLDATHTIQVNGTPEIGATSADFYRSAGGASQGRPLGCIGIPIITGQPLFCVDVGAQADTQIAPTTPTCLIKVAASQTLSVSGTSNLANATTINGVTAQGDPTVAFSATPVFNMGLGDPKITLTGNVTSSTMTGMVAGRKYNVSVCQDGAGSHSFVAPTTWLGLPTFVTTASVCNYWPMESWDGTNLQYIGTAH